jgi:hypothetical protein
MPSSPDRTARPASAEQLAVRKVAITIGALGRTAVEVAELRSAASPAAQLVRANRTAAACTHSAAPRCTATH